MATFRGAGKATIGIFGVSEWKTFLRVVNEASIRLSEEEIEKIASKADFDNHSIEGSVNIEWPVVTLEFEIASIGKTLTINRQLSGMIQLFTCKRPWSSGSNGVSVLKFDGYEWVFEQQSYSLGFKAWIKKEGSTVVNFEFNETK